MSSFRIYRVFHLENFPVQGVASSENDRNNYRFSIVVTDDKADYVVNPAFSPEKTLSFLRNRLDSLLKKRDEPPKNVEEWSDFASYNLGMYQKFSLVLDEEVQNQPLVDFDTVREREESHIEAWIAEDFAPPNYTVAINE